MNLVDNIAAFTNVLGTRNPDVVFGFATIPWESVDSRNKFIGELLQLNDNKKIGD